MAKTRQPSKRATKAKDPAPNPVQRATVGVFGHNRVPEPFSRSAALREVQSWIAAAIEIKANAIAQVPLRLYVRNRSSAKTFWPHRQVANRRKSWMLGESRSGRTPSREVVRKVIDWGSDFVEVTDHPVLDLLHKVNPWMNGYDFLATKEMFLDATGDAYWFMSRDSMRVSELWPMSPHAVKIVPSATSFVDHYEYSPSAGTDAVSIPAEDVIHFRLPSIRSPWYGAGIVEKGWLAILSNRARHEHDVAFWQNYARPDYLWILKQSGLDQSEIDAFTAAMEQKFKGHRKSGRHAAVTGDVDIKPMQWPPKDNPNDTPTIEEIAAVSGVPVSMLMANDPNLASAQVGYSWFMRQTVAPRCKLCEETLNATLLREFDEGGDAVLAYDDPVPENEDAESIVWDRRLRNASVTVNEYRSEMGEEASSDPYADTLLFGGQPLGASSSFAAPTLPPAVAPQKSMRKTVEYVAGSDPMSECVARKVRVLIAEGYAQDQAVAIAYSMCGEESKRAAQASDDCGCGSKHVASPLSQKSWLGSFTKADAADTVRDDESERAIKRFISDMDAIGAKQVSSIVDVLRRRGLSGRELLHAAMLEASRVEWVREIAAAARPYIENAVKMGGGSGAAMLPTTGDVFAFDFANPEVSKYVDRATTKLAAGVNETTTMRVRSVIGGALDRGATVDEIAAEVTAKTGIDGARAEMIARYESAKAYVQGQIESWKQSGVVSGKRWLLAPDACEFCRAVAREFENKSIALGERFYHVGQTIEGVSGGKLVLDYESIDGAPLHPGCRCDVVPVLDPALTGGAA